MSLFKNINKKLLPMKVVMFGWFGAYASVLPFMTIHMKELGLTVEETAIIYTLLPVTQFLASPIAGFIADKLGKYRNVLLLSLVMTIVFATALLFVPPVNEFPLQNTSSVTILCNDVGVTAVTCDFMENNNNLSSLHLSSCHNHNCNQSHISNVSWDMVLQLTNLSNISSCEYQASIVQSSYNASFLMCQSPTTNLASNCSIMCSNINTAVMSSEMLGSNRRLTFYLYSILRIVYNIFSSIGFTLVNASAIALTETNEDMGEYGRQRLWAMVAMAIFSPLSGIFVDLLSKDGVVNYAPAFHFHNILALLTGVTVWFLDFEMEEAPTSYAETFKNFWKIIKNPSIFFLLVVVFWLGTVWGFMESFLFWFMIELDSPTYIMGLTVTIGSLVGLPFLYYARFIVKKVGHANILSVAVFMYMVRCIGCSFLVDPWWIMPFEVLEIFTFHLMWVAAATYAAHLSPPGLLATIQGFIEGVHYGVGQGSGSLIGGSLMSIFGSRKAFQVMGIVSGIVAAIYSSLHFLWLRKIIVGPQSRRASVKSYSSQKIGRKSSTLSHPDVNGATTSSTLHSTSSIQETPN